MDQIRRPEKATEHFRKLGCKQALELRLMGYPLEHHMTPGQGKKSRTGLGWHAGFDPKEPSCISFCAGSLEHIVRTVSCWGHR